MTNRFLVALSLPVLVAGVFALSACKNDSDDNAPAVVPSISTSIDVVPSESVAPTGPDASGSGPQVSPSDSVSASVDPSASVSASDDVVHDGPTSSGE